MKIDMMLDEFMATKVMGWHKWDVTKKGNWVWVKDREFQGYYLPNDNEDKPVWKPTKDMNQVELCLNMWHSKSTCNISSITRNGKKYSVILDDANFILGAAHNEDMKIAICEAIREAVELK